MSFRQEFEKYACPVGEELDRIDHHRSSGMLLSGINIFVRVFERVSGHDRVSERGAHAQFTYQPEIFRFGQTLLEVSISLTKFSWLSRLKQ